MDRLGADRWVVDRADENDIALSKGAGEGLMSELDRGQHAALRMMVGNRLGADVGTMIEQMTVAG